MAIKIFEDFLELDFIKYVKNKIYNEINSSVWRSNLGWSGDIVKNSQPILLNILNNDTYIYNYLSNKYNNLFNELKNKEIKILYYIYSRLSYIPLHNDDTHFFASTIYLNENWNEDFGGLFLYKENNEMKAICPKFNLAITNDNNIIHGTTLVNIDAPYRETIQIFFDNKK